MLVPITVICPQCNSISEVADSAAGARGKCRSCGSVIHVPAKAEKICADCGADVSQQPRTKDADGRYYCNLCWIARQNAQAAPDVEASETTSTPPEKSLWSSETKMVLSILVPIFVIGAAVVGWLLWSSHAQQQLRDQIAQMKNAADERFASGDFQGAFKQYDDLLTFGAQHKVRDDPLGILADAQHQKQSVTAKLEQQAEAQRQENERLVAAEKVRLQQRETQLAAERAAADVQRQATARQYAIASAAADAFMERRARIGDEAASIPVNDKLNYFAGETDKAASNFGQAVKSLDLIANQPDFTRAVEAVSAIQKLQAGLPQTMTFALGFQAANMDSDARAQQDVLKRNVAEITQWSRELAKCGANMTIAAGGAKAPMTTVVSERATNPSSAAGTETAFLADLKEAQVDCWTDPARRMVFHKGVSDWNNLPISVGGMQSPHGLFTHPPAGGSATVRYAMDGTFDIFWARVGISDDNDPPPQSPVVFSVMGDGKALWTSSPFTAKGRTEVCSVNIRGVKELALVARATGSNYFAHAVWLEPQVMREGAKPKEPVIAPPAPTARSKSPNPPDSPSTPAKDQQIADAVNDLAKALDGFYATSAKIDQLTAQCSAAQDRGDAATSSRIIGELRTLDDNLKQWE
jgi:hypothetical protein